MSIYGKNCLYKPMEVPEETDEEFEIDYVYELSTGRLRLTKVTPDTPANRDAAAKMLHEYEAEIRAEEEEAFWAEMTERA